jgi:hypothetical protein
MRENLSIVFVVKMLRIEKMFQREKRKKRSVSLTKVDSELDIFLAPTLSFSSLRIIIYLCQKAFTQLMLPLLSLELTVCYYIFFAKCYY